ncbi:hypothetical protein QTO34_001191 [Cnephaeus nilssonii]|uniref:Calponin-homology (CH) domain-containing protein n=1 Tax=Cnephaeus nilssonii TaxID=3371016 RepID=A0AA40HV86_CNENI|nr:hypothetical protein QTO34_001191 [Eptesicus nilssonii]
MDHRPWQASWVSTRRGLPRYRITDPDEHNDVQKKTFTKWINARFSKTKGRGLALGGSPLVPKSGKASGSFPGLGLCHTPTSLQRFPGGRGLGVAKSGKPPISDMFTDLKDGRKLLDLLEGLTGASLPKERGSTRVHALNNVNRVLQVLHQNNVDLVNIGGTDIVDGNHKLTLGLLWSIILHWQVKDVMKDIMSALQQTNSEKILLSWVRQSTRPYSQVNVLNFTTSWTDGLAFNALLHRHKPDLFSWDRVVKMSPTERLEHAFSQAQMYLGIEKLLDPEDVAVQLPDKKSIIMYLTSLFEVLPQQVTIDAIREVETLPRKYKKECEEGDINIQSSAPEEEHGSPRADTPSTVTEVDMDLDSYQTALEDVLTWLLSAEDTFQEQDDISEDVEEVKEQFATHEAFMMELTAHQSSVGSVLQAGNQLITQGTLSDEEEFEIQEQMTLLNARWEALRVESMDRQSRLHDVLMELQKQQLQQLSAWLTLTEERIQKMETCPLDDDLQSLQKLLEDHKSLQNDLEAEQVKVNSLTHMVVIVDENSGESATAVLEDQLQCLLKAWLTEKEEALNKVQTRNFRDQKELSISVRRLAVSDVIVSICPVTQAVGKLGMSQIPQKDLLETVHIREQVTTKRSKQELPPPPPPKKRQIPVDMEAKKNSVPVLGFDALSAELLDWILKSKTAIQATEIKEYKKMQETSEMKKKLKRELTNLLGLHPRIETVRASCAALKSRPSAPDFVQQGFERLLGRYQSVQQDLEDRQQQLENVKGKQGQADSKVIEKWMEGAKDFLMEEQAVPGDDEGLQRQLDQCSAFVKEIDTVESSLKDMKEVETHLQSCPVAGIKTWVQTKLVDYQTQLEKCSKEDGRVHSGRAGERGWAGRCVREGAGGKLTRRCIGSHAGAPRAAVGWDSGVTPWAAARGNHRAKGTPHSTTPPPGK